MIAAIKGCEEYIVPLDGTDKYIFGSVADRAMDPIFCFLEGHLVPPITEPGTDFFI